MSEEDAKRERNLHSSYMYHTNVGYHEDCDEAGTSDLPHQVAPPSNLHIQTTNWIIGQRTP